MASSTGRVTGRLLARELLAATGDAFVAGEGVADAALLPFDTGAV
jgi:hypothetical protein